MSKLEDLTGKKFGRLTVIKRHGCTDGVRKLPTWLCLCDCGNTAIRTGKALKSSKNSGCDICRWSYLDLTGKVFGSLTVISKHSSGNGEVIWNCKCDCGNVIQVSTGKLNFGLTTSCGCAKRNRIIERNTTHGLSNTRLYKIWCDMKKRCCNYSSKRYKDYGGRGIDVCNEWKNDFMSFYNWAMANGYSDDLTIDRIDTNGNYEPSNCRWVSMKVQANNTRKNIKVTYNGEIHTISEWIEIIGVSRRVMENRIKKYGHNEAVRILMEGDIK